MPDGKDESERRVAERAAELRAAHQSRAEQSRYLEAFFRHSLTPMAFLDRDFNFIRVNEAYAKADQRDVGEFPGQNQFEFYPSDAKAIFEEVVRTKQPFRANARPFVYAGHPDRGVTYWDWTLSTLLDEHGEVEVLVFALEDVTERKRAEIELEMHHEHLEELVRERTRAMEAANARLQAEIDERMEVENQLAYLASFPERNPNPIMEVDLEGYLRYVNPAALNLFPDLREKGLAHQWLADWAAAVRPFREGQTGNGLRDLIIGKSVYQQALYYFAQDGIIRIYGFDITERKQAEETLRESEERYRAMAEELREADRHKNEFLAMLSHELRNPLASIQNSLNILDRAAPGGEQAKRAKAVIDRQFGQLTHLVDDLLDITRITRNKIRLQRRRLELSELVRRTLEDHRPLFEKNSVQLEAEFASSPVFVDADEARLVQVVGNLLLNAAKFTRRGDSARVSVAGDAAARRAYIRVADTGAGMPPEMLPRLFEPFMQAERTLDRSHGGLGLGLALSKGLVKLHGGSISAQSGGIGRGSEFVVQLPLAVALPEEPPAVRAEIARRRRRVLIIDDNVDVAESLRELLELDGHEVAVADNGPEGLRKAREFRPEVLLCDIGLPGMDGYAVARAFRADKTLKGVFLVALSGYALPEDLRRAAEAGFDHHMAKPPDMNAIERTLAEIPIQALAE